jgi:hypothetical protein
MQLNYTPFLKLKKQEITALKMLDSIWHPLLVPFFDFPAKEDTKKPWDYAEKSNEMAAYARNHISTFSRFYLDSFDVEDHLIQGKHNYLYLLEQFSNFDVIPVTGPDRTDDHRHSIRTFIQQKTSPSIAIAYRVTVDDFASFNATKDEVAESLDGLINYLFTEVHLIIDCRLLDAFLGNKHFNNMVKQITNYIVKFTQSYPVSKVIITGSMIPVSLASLVKANSHGQVERFEISIYDAVKSFFTADHCIGLGDYTTVSPEFAEPNEQSSQNATSKLVYAHDKQQYIWRGTKVMTNPSKQYLYNQHARDMINFRPSVFRGKNYSWADSEFFDKQNDVTGFWTNSINKFLINAHISYMLHTYSH